MIWVLLAGVAVGFIFDFYRSLRKWMGWGKFATYAGDVVFSLSALALLFRFFLHANELELRFYILWGSVLGLFIYTRILSRGALWIFFKFYRMVDNLLWLIREGFKIPVRGLILLMRPPYALLRWFSMLIFRIIENFFAEPLNRMRKNVLKFLNKLFPPRTNG